jgi:type II secretory ATPase GspE/PulE/Tfp pilus assembly ATPase PilB-like protein
MADRRQARLGERLVAMGMLEPSALELALAVQQRTGKRLGEILRAHGLAPAEAIAQALAEQARYPWVAPAAVESAPASRALLEALGTAWCRQAQVYPCALDGREAAVIADPFALAVTDRLRRQAPRAALAVSTPDAVERALARATAEHERRISASLTELEARGVDSGQLPALLRSLIDRALDLRASDLHIEPLGDSVLVRCRVDGMLRALHALPRALHPNVVNVLWEWAALPHGDTQRIVDGSFSHRTLAGHVDVRLSAVPTEAGPSIVLRLLDPRRHAVQLPDLGYSPDREARILDLLRAPYGLLLVTGPTGSGKTTTLYAIINRLNDQHVKILTVEDPVEVRLSRVQQVAIREAVGVTFESATRAFLRQDPDVVLVGEIRDAGTAREAIRAALTGRRVLSTLHTSTACGAIPRLLELGAEPGLLADTLIGVIAQRLVRLRCPSCRGPAANGDGPCRHCGGSGERGRTVVSEVLVVTERLRRLIEQRAQAWQLLAAARAEGFSDMRDDARALVAAGRVRRQEAERVLGPLDAVAAEPEAPGPAVRGPAVAEAR